MRRIATALLAASAALPAFAQVDCGEPLDGQDAKFGIDYARNVTLPLIEHNAGGLGPVLWTYIAGQARGESLGDMRDKQMDFIPKPNLNLWNVQTDATSSCRSNTEVVCPDDMKNLPPIPRNPIKYNGCFVNSAGDSMKWTVVCFPEYTSIQQAADGYLLPFKSYTKRLQELSKGNPTPEDFFSELKGTRWADSAEKPHYRTDTLDAIRQVLRGLATLRKADEAALGETSKQIDAWCAQPGQGNAAERAALSAKQTTLLKSLSAVGSVCTAPAGATAPATNSAIGTCRTQPDPPATPPGTGGHGGASGQGTGQGNNGGAGHRPQGSASGIGEPHYRLPGGQTLSTQRAGEFLLLDAPDGTRVQVRQIPWHQSRQVAAIGAIAAQVGAHRVGVYSDGRVLVDDKALQWTGDFHQRALGSDAVVGTWGPQERPSQVAIMWRNGRTLRVHLRSSWLDVETAWAQGTAVANDQGLIGRASSTSQGALIGRDGQRGSLTNSDQADAFVASWRIKAQESLFDYRPGESSATFDLRGFPEEPAKPTREALEAAAKACMAAGIPANHLEPCAFDLAVTGTNEFLVSHLPVVGMSSTPSKPKAPPLGAFPALFTPDIANPLQSLPNGKRFDTSIGLGEQRTYHIDAKRDDPTVFLAVTSNNLTCVAEEVDGSKPAYQLFDARGHAVSQAKPTCSDLLIGDVEEGDYYLVIKGANGGQPAEVSLEAWAN